MHFRDATAGDAQTLVELMHQAFEEDRLELEPPSAAHGETVDTVLKKLETASAILALVEGHAAGFTFLEPKDDCLYFSRLSVLPAFRNRGIGGALIEEVEKRAAQAGYGCVRLGVRLQLPELIALYERRGYRITEYRHHSGYSTPTYLFMEKDLSC